MDRMIMKMKTILMAAEGIDEEIEILIAIIMVIQIDLIIIEGKEILAEIVKTIMEDKMETLEEAIGEDFVAALEEIRIGKIKANIKKEVVEILIDTIMIGKTTDSKKAINLLIKSITVKSQFTTLSQ